LKLPVRLKILIARKKSFIAAMSISVELGGGGVTSVSGNHATVSVTGGADVAVTKTS
jgi:hypothetical protein